MYQRIIYPDSDLHGTRKTRAQPLVCIVMRTTSRSVPGERVKRDRCYWLFATPDFKNQGINMLNYERHLIVVTVICLVIIAVAIVAIVMGVPLPFIGKD